MLRHGTWIPDNLKSDHQQFDVPSPKLDVYQDKQIKTLDAWHNFTIEHNILYSLYAGSLLGFYRTGYMIPWDDDVDIVVRPKDWKKIEYLWNSGTNEKNYNVKWTRKEIQLNGKTYTMFKWVEDSIKKWFKIRDLNHEGIKVGGIDIWICSNNFRVQSHSQWICPGPTDASDPSDFPISRFRSPNNIANARIPKESIAKSYLSKTYGNWEKPAYPGSKNAGMKKFR